MISNDDLPVLPSVQTMLQRNRWVDLHTEFLLPAVEQWGDSLESASHWQHPCHFFDGSERTVRWIFVLDVLNHCFWPMPGETRWAVDYQGEQWSGYFGLAAALKRALEDGYPVTDAEWLAGLSRAQLSDVFAGSGEIPLLDERLANLNEAGCVLIDHWRGDATRLVRAAEGSAVRLCRLVTEFFPSFRDEAEIRGVKVYLWKRAQIFASDLHSAFDGQGPWSFRDVDRLTAFADYKLPQVLRELGILSYRRELAEAVDRRRLLPPGGEWEVEIRAATLWAVEMLRIAFAGIGIETTAPQVDNWLWNLGQMDRFRNRPYHLCRTIYY